MLRKEEKRTHFFVQKGDGGWCHCFLNRGGWSDRGIGDGGKRRCAKPHGHLLPSFKARSYSSFMQRRERTRTPHGGVFRKRDRFLVQPPSHALQKKLNRNNKETEGKKRILQQKNLSIFFVIGPVVKLFLYVFLYFIPWSLKPQNFNKIRERRQYHIVCVIYIIYYLYATIGLKVSRRRRRDLGGGGELKGSSVLCTVARVVFYFFGHGSGMSVT